MANDPNLDPKTLVVPGHGNVLISTDETAEPFDITGFNIKDTATYGPGWESLGYTSKENTVEFSKDGGDVSSVDTWEEDGMDTTYEATLWSVLIRALSMQRKTFEYAFGGGQWDEKFKGYGMGDVEPITKSMMIIFAHNGKRAGAYIRRVKIGAGDAPSIDPEQFFEIELKGDILASDSATYKKIFWYSARPYDASVPPAPVETPGQV